MSIVIKYGGSAMTDSVTRAEVAAQLRELGSKGNPPVVVHGGGPFIEAALDAAGLPHSFVNGLRVTSPESLTIVERVVTLLGKELAQEIGAAVGLTGRDAGLLLAVAREAQLGRVGRMTAVNPRPLAALRSAGLVPVVGCVALDGDGAALNVNADEVASAVAGALGEGVLFLTNVAGVLDDAREPGSLLAELTRDEALVRIADGRIAGGMIPKVQAALDALALGAPFAIIADGRSASSSAAALRGGGTRISGSGDSPVRVALIPSPQGGR